MKVAEERRQFWRSPSGRIHGMRTCSGVGGVKMMRSVRLTRAQWERETRCRCCTWTDRS